MEKLKTISKYIANILSILNALLLGLQPIWDIPYVDKITASITVVIGVIGTYLLGTKSVSKIKSKNTSV